MNSEGSGYIKVSGGLITSQFISSMQKERVSVDYAHPSTFKVPWNPDDTAPDEKEYELRVKDAFESLKRRWDMYGEKLRSMDPKDARNYWQRPLLEALGFNITYTSARREISENLKFSFSHRGWRKELELPNPPVIHIIPPSQGLDERPVRGEPSAHDALQGFLNTEDDKWALLTNGLFLRLLRDFHHTTVKGYVEFDIEAIFHNRLYSDFQALYRFAHSSRFAPVPSKKTSKKVEVNEEGEEIAVEEEVPEIYLEEYFKHSQSVGESVGKNLRENVVKAIEAFGNGFLTNELMEKLRADEKECHAYYEEILRVIYRIIFLLYAEQRGLLGGHGEPGNDLYLENYSITALRNFAIETIEDNNFQHDSHIDLWEGLLITFKMISEGVKTLDIYPYDGMLFDMSGDKYVGKHGCKNNEFLEAIRFLTLTEIDGVRQTISYSDLSVEEFGSIYESLLDYAPRITLSLEEIEGRQYAPNRFILDPRGSDRKSTGSYYTNPGLVQELIKSALVPVLEARLQDATDTRQAKEKALLSIKVCDPACGSGAFLIAACNKLGRELAKIRTGEELPAFEVEQEARRDVLLHCIYGVDINPMAVELARVSLWINAVVPEKPLNFLDHHVKCGNSLVGATPELMEKGIPDGAFTSVEGDDKKVANHFKKINKEFLKGIKEQYRSSSISEWVIKEGSAKVCSAEFAKLGDEVELTPEQVKDKKERYKSLLTNKKYNRIKFLADLWTSAFFWELTNTKEEVPTNKTYLTLATDENLDPNPEFAKRVSDLAQEYKFFHWHLEFPGVFSGEKQGFDCVLGNPPWERIKLQEKEFFEYRSPEIAKVSNASQRKKLIQKLREEDTKLDQAFRKAKRMSECESLFLRESGRFPLTGKGDVNTYAVFTELTRSIIGLNGKTGIIVPTGIATDFTYCDFFSDIMKREQLVSLYDFENREGLFPGTHRQYKFSLLTVSGGSIPKAQFAFFLHNIGEINKSRYFTLSYEDLSLINPNTKTVPVLKNIQDAELIKRLHRNVRVLIDESNQSNLWGVTFNTMYHMTNDSHLFYSENSLSEKGCNLEKNLFIGSEEIYLPLYEGKMIYQFDHRFANINEKTLGNETVPKKDSSKDPDISVIPRYWVKYSEVSSYLNGKKSILGFRGITNPENERTMISAVLPICGCGNSLPLISIENNKATDLSLLAACLNTFIIDWVARMKAPSRNMNLFIIRQLPVIEPSQYKQNVINFVVSIVVELTYTAWDLEPFAVDILEEIGPEKWNEWFPENPLVDGIPQPFKWDEERRLKLRCELDAVYAHLYGISKDDLDYILGTFPIVKRKDEAKYRTYRTRDLILEYYDKYHREGVFEKGGSKI